MWQKVAKFKGAEYFRKALYVYVLGNVLVTSNLMLITLAYVAQPSRRGHTNPIEVKLYHDPKCRCRLDIGLMLELAVFPGHVTGSGEHLGLIYVQ